MLNKRPKTRILLAITGAIASGIVSAASVQLSPTNPSMGIGGNAVTAITFTGDAFVTNVSGRINYNTTIFDAAVTNGTATCTLSEVNGRVVFVTTSGTGLPIPNQTLCNVTFTHTGGAAISEPYTFSNMVFAGTGAADTFPGGNLNVTLGPAVGPAITYTPAVNAAPATITFPAATSIGGTTVAAITTVIGAGGSNSGTNVVSACTGSANVTFTDTAEICTAGGACVDGNLELQCVATNAAQTGTASCTETRQNETGSGDGNTAVSTRSWGFTCPAANVAPTLTAAPNFDADATTDGTAEVTLPIVGIGQIATGNVAVTPANGSGTGAATMGSCVGALGISVAPATLTFTGSSTASQNLAFSCTAAAGSSAGTVTCTETDGDSAGVTRLWDVACPAGTPESAPNVTYNPPAGPLVFAQGASIGSPTTQPVTVDINGGLDGGDGTPESTSVTCTTASTGFSVGATGGPFSANSPASVGVDGTVTVTCSAAATVQAGTMSCTATPRVDGVAGAPTVTDFALDCPAAAVNVASNPPEGNVNLFGVPATDVPGSIILSNTGSSSTLSCTSGGSVTLVNVPATIGAGGSATVQFTCLAGAAGANNPGTIQCLTQDAGAEGTLDYAVNCTGLARNPIPAISDLGKVLLASLVIGLGLLGLGARRQMI